MNQEVKIEGLSKLGQFLSHFLEKKNDNLTILEKEFYSFLKRAEVENPWFTQDNLNYCLTYWAKSLDKKKLSEWLGQYKESENPKKVGLILAGNIPLVGFHDIMCVILSNNIPLIKLSSKDRVLIPFLLKLWRDFSDNIIVYQLEEKLKDFDAIIATGSTNTSRYLEYYFKKYPSIIRKNRTSIAILTGDESNEELKKLADDIFRYFGLGCRNVTRLFVSDSFNIERLFENFFPYKEIIHHHKYGNNYDYHRAIFLLDKETFWDNNFMLLREEDQLFSPLSVVNFSRYKNIKEVEDFIKSNKNNIQCIVADPKLNFDSINFGEAQNPSIDTYADNIDTMAFLQSL